MKRKVQVVGDKVKPLNEKNGHLSTHEVELSEQQFNSFTSSKCFILDNGVPRGLTESELTSLQAEEIKQKAISDAQIKLQENLLTCTVEVDGMEFYTRPEDEVKYRTILGSLEDGQTYEKILVNNTVATVTKEQLQQVFSLGLQKVEGFYSEYKEALKES